MLIFSLKDKHNVKRYKIMSKIIKLTKNILV